MLNIAGGIFHREHLSNVACILAANSENSCNLFCREASISFGNLYDIWGKNDLVEERINVEFKYNCSRWKSDFNFPIYAKNGVCS